MLVAAFVAICLLNGAVSAPLDDVLPIGPVQMTVWEVLIGVKRQTGRNCPLGYKLCDDGCAPVVSTCCGDGDGSYCRLVEYCTLGGCCPMLRQCGGYNTETSTHYGSSEPTRSAGRPNTEPTSDLPFGTDTFSPAPTSSSSNALPGSGVSEPTSAARSSSSTGQLPESGTSSASKPSPPWAETAPDTTITVVLDPPALVSASKTADYVVPNDLNQPFPGSSGSTSLTVSVVLVTVSLSLTIGFLVHNM
ncbi:hypothetical protein A1Q1_06009 [Trichosporon asahii var. asahii CBS 2479]|uniref:Uncharacterized protein n=1 Tax=Trichosporon asahii var. asahii (strain ATCC 90039 / CBS 2479 / JCM 2466 / KCTC 7840 / NBRC 103889/ NCYC 2677 / UAMH 7654) TaxID=1186058 RepID=J5Q5G7_TRIAS|nr:hypothetical protein A1Q1_06009 [Trichosporon asahii var. asahii CBS 2479]EJT45563.1 hypothetical protein A1Q1_06009 [Trichosporon asahii var. asahii CBS 2479]